jgi:hypothetical protein
VRQARPDERGHRRRRRAAASAKAQQHRLLCVSAAQILADGRMDISLAVYCYVGLSWAHPAPHCYAMSGWGILDGFHLLLFNRAVGAKINGI